MSGPQMVTAATVAGAVVFGMMLALVGSLKQALTGRPQSGDVPVRRLLAGLNTALVPMVLLGGVLADLYGARLVLLVGSVLLAVGLVSLSLRPTYPHAFASVLLAGMGAAAVGTASTVLMPQAFFASVETSASLNLGYAFVALGALLAPVLADVLLGALGFRRALGLFALLALAPAFLAVFAGGESSQGEPADGAAALLAEQVVWPAALVFFFYVPLEASVSLWTLSLLSEHGRSEREAAGLLAGFWGAFVGSRLLAALAQHEGWLSAGWDRWLVAVPPLLAAVVLGNLAGASRRGRPRVGLILLGLLLGPVWPTLLGLVFHVATGRQGLAYGAVFTAGSLGSLLLSPVLAVRSRPPFAAALRAPILLALLLTAAALVLGLMTP